jgi:hypothetical protein
MAGICAKSGPPVNQYAFRHDLAGIPQRRFNGNLNLKEPSIQQEILAGLLIRQGRRCADQHHRARSGQRRSFSHQEQNN